MSMLGAPVQSYLRAYQRHLAPHCSIANDYQSQYDHPIGAVQAKALRSTDTTVFAGTGVICFCDDEGAAGDAKSGR